MTQHKILHYWALKVHGACEPQRRLFKEVFGYRVTINKENMLKAHKNGLDIFWFMRTFVSYENWHDFSACMEEQWYSHKAEITYDYDKAVSNIIDRFLSYE